MYKSKEVESIHMSMRRELGDRSDPQRRHRSRGRRPRRSWHGIPIARFPSAEGEATIELSNRSQLLSRRPISFGSLSGQSLCLSLGPCRVSNVFPRQVSGLGLALVPASATPLFDISQDGLPVQHAR